jgi:hypothetical protein
MDEGEGVGDELTSVTIILRRKRWGKICRDGDMHSLSQIYFLEEAERGLSHARPMKSIPSYFGWG